MSRAKGIQEELARDRKAAGELATILPKLSDCFALFSGDAAQNGDPELAEFFARCAVGSREEGLQAGQFAAGQRQTY